tara:strand:+ start:255 stop:392 length:138 start_codon:yes stop_codon:yes gene_type:complete
MESGVGILPPTPKAKSIQQILLKTMPRIIGSGQLDRDEIAKAWSV